MSNSVRIVLSDGQEFHGKGFGAIGEVTGHLVVATTATGVERVLADPANAGAIVLLTTPHVGNTGLEGAIVAGGIIARDPVPRASSAHAVIELEDQLRADGVVGIREVDTRAIARIARANDVTATIVSEEN
ncbi:carbamoyl-phosphate synthase domain-containing protein [Trueperella pyogenes]